jgi:hypothetical protein
MKWRYTPFLYYNAILMITGDSIITSQFAFWIRQPPIAVDDNNKEEEDVDDDASTQDYTDPVPPPIQRNGSIEEYLDTDSFTDIDIIEATTEKPKTTVQKRHADSAALYTPLPKKTKHTGIRMMGMVGDGMLAIADALKASDNGEKIYNNRETVDATLVGQAFDRL